MIAGPSLLQRFPRIDRSPRRVTIIYNPQSGPCRKRTRISHCAGGSSKRLSREYTRRRAGLRPPRRQGRAGIGSGNARSIDCATRAILPGISIAPTSIRLSMAMPRSHRTGRTPRFVAGCGSAPILRAGRATPRRMSARSAKGDGFRRLNPSYVTVALPLKHPPWLRQLQPTHLSDRETGS